MDPSLHAHVKLDVVSDVVRIDVRGSLTHASRPALMQIIQRVRRMGIISHIRVDLGGAAFVESSALAGLRHDLNAIDRGSAGSEIAGMPATGGVSLDLSQHGDDTAVLETLDLSGGFTASVGPSGAGPLTGYSDDALLAASDAVFGLLDDPADMARTELLATYDEIGIEISRREVDREPDPV
jgi:anti-anti-sigma regulatory factor